MKKLGVLLTLILCFTLVGCSSKKETTINTFIDNIYASNDSFTSYQESDVLLDNEVEVYHKDITFQIERGEEIKTTFNQYEKKLSDDILSETNYDEKTTSYYTIGNHKYDTTYGLNTESSYPIPSYFFTFNIKEDYLTEHKLTKDGKTITLNANVKNESVNDFFVTFGIESITDVVIEVKVVDKKLSSMNAQYKTTTGFVGNVNITYGYDKVTIEH